MNDPHSPNYLTRTELQEILRAVELFNKSLPKQDGGFETINFEEVYLSDSNGERIGKIDFNYSVNSHGEYVFIPVDEIAHENSFECGRAAMRREIQSQQGPG